MLALLISLVLIDPVSKEATRYLFNVTVYQGNPDGSKEMGNIEVLSRPQLVTRNGQSAQVQVGQMVQYVTDMKSNAGGQPDEKLLKKLVTLEQVGMTFSLTPEEQADGSVFLTANMQLKELVKDVGGVDLIMERVIKVCRNNKLGEKITLPLYNPNDYVEHVKQSGSNELLTRRKPYTGKETWVELIITELKP